MAAAAFAPVSTGILVPAAAADQYPESFDKTFKQTLIRSVDGFDEEAYRERYADCELDEHTTEVHRVESAPVVKAGAVQKLFSKPRRRAEILSWHLRRQGKWRDAKKFDATLNAVRKPPKEDPMLKERSRFWRKHAPPRFKLEAISATQDRRDLHRDPPVLTWGTEHEANQRDASPRIKEAYRAKAEKRERQMAIREAEEQLRDACDSRDQDAVDHALRHAKSVGVPRDSEAYELGRFVQKDLVRQRAYDEKQRLLKLDKQELENTGKYLWKARHYTDPTCFGTDDDIVQAARTGQMDLADGSVSTIKSNVNPKKLPPAIKPHAETFHPQRVRHHYTPGSPTVTVERAGAVVCKRATPHRARRRYP